ncbi:MAG: DegT/DnrJ/EryC1/StrS family aminotransferase, partial [Dehalococcoidia bacterium]|nr:DegT/DnrJ/EryC1/StrS family aminotransferase [Dehalococcoidia bacterium]
VKNLPSPDGGAILTDDDDQAVRLRALRWCGIDRSTWARTGKTYAWDYDIAEVGYKCHWNDVAAAIALVHLRHLDEQNDRRRSAAVYYTNNLAGVQLPSDHYAHTWHLYTIRVAPGLRDGLIDHLAERGIGTSVHYKPLPYYPPFAGQETPPITEREWRRLLSLPMYADITRQEQDQVIEAVNGYMEAHR